MVLRRNLESRRRRTFSYGGKPAVAGEPKSRTEKNQYRHDSRATASGERAPSASKNLGTMHKTGYR